MNYIEKITEISNVYLVNTHDDYHIPKKKILKVDYDNGCTHYLDPILESNIQGDYWKLESIDKTEEKVIFQNVEIEGSPLPDNN